MERFIHSENEGPRAETDHGYPPRSTWERSAGGWRDNWLRNQTPSNELPLPSGFPVGSAAGRDAPRLVDNLLPSTLQSDASGHLHAAGTRCRVDSGAEEHSTGSDTETEPWLLRAGVSDK